MCQRAHGAAFVTWVSVDEERLTIDDARARLRWHASSREARRGFCADCGSSLFFRSSKWPGEIHVARANFVDDVGEAPQVHGYYDTHVAWFEPSDALPKKAEETK